MKTNIALKHLTIKEVLGELASVTGLGEYKERRIEGTLNSIVYVKGRANILLKELFSPLCRTAVVIRRCDGSRIDPCDFGSYLSHNKLNRR